MVFTSFRLPVSESRIELYQIESGERRVLIENAIFARYLTSRHLAFVRDGTLFVAPFDHERLEVTGPPVSVLDGAVASPYNGNSQYAVSDTGTLVHLPASVLGPARTVVWIDRDGREEIFFWNDGRLFAVPVSTRPAVTVGEPVGLFASNHFANWSNRGYDVSSDGQRVVLARTPETSMPREARVVFNWFTEIERLAGPGGAR